MQFGHAWKLLKALLAYEGEPVAALKLVTTIIVSYIPEFERRRDGLLARYGEKFLMGPEE